jgi:hypothetical protein
MAHMAQTDHQILGCLKAKRGGNKKRIRKTYIINNFVILK